MCSVRTHSLAYGTDRAQFARLGLLACRLLKEVTARHEEEAGTERERRK